MNRRSLLRVALAVVVIAVAVGAPVAWWFTREVVTCGIVIGIDQASITDVRGFSLRTSDGITSSYVVVPARLAADSFVPGHLREHRALATPVCVTSRPAESPAVALDLRDAPPADSPVEPSPSSTGSSPDAVGSPVAFHSERYGYGLVPPTGFTATEPPGTGGVHPGDPGVDTFGDGHGTRLYAIRFPVTPGTVLAAWVCPVSTHLVVDHHLVAETTDALTVGGQPARLSSYHLKLPPYVTLYLEAEVVGAGGGYAFGLESTTGRDADDRALLVDVLRTVTFEA